MKTLFIIMMINFFGYYGFYTLQWIEVGMQSNDMSATTFPIQAIYGLIGAAICAVGLTLQKKKIA